VSLTQRNINVIFELLALIGMRQGRCEQQRLVARDARTPFRGAATVQKLDGTKKPRRVDGGSEVK